MDFSLSSRSSLSQSQLTRDDLQQQQPQPQPESANDDDVAMDAEAEEAARAQDEYRSGLRRRVAAYEQCVEAVGVLTASLEELSAKIEAMKTSTQQLNAFTSGWLTVWQRSA
jgi:hypothetical protein